MQTQEPAPAFKWYVFVDFENVPEVDLARLEGKPARVTLLIGKNQKKLDLTLVRQIHRLADQVELVEVGASGHNALDLTLAYHLGREVERHPEAHFGVVSKDKDFDPLIAHLRASKVEVARYSEFRVLPLLNPPKATARAKPPAATAGTLRDRRELVIATIKDPETPNRPTTKTKLIRFIENQLGTKPSDAETEGILRELIESKAIAISDAGSVAYTVELNA